MPWLLIVLPLTLHAQELPDPDETAYPAIERFIQVLEQVHQRHPDADKLASSSLGIAQSTQNRLQDLSPDTFFVTPFLQNERTDPRP